MTRRWPRRSREVEPATPLVDAELTADSGEVLRDEREFLEAESPLESQVLAEFRDFVLTEFAPWASAARERLRATPDAAIAREVEASYTERFKATVTALGPELRGRGCLSPAESGQILEARTAWEVVALGPLLVKALQQLGDLTTRDARHAAPEREFGDGGLLPPPYEEH